MRLAETIDRWLGRVEVALGGAEGALRDGQEAIADGDAMRARAAAHAILTRVPGSPLGLALLADACEMAGLVAELALTLEELAIVAASRADVWVRLGRVRALTDAPNDDVRDAFVRALSLAAPGDDARDESLLALADLDLARGDGARAELWLERTSANVTPRDAGGDGDPIATSDRARLRSEVALRRAEAAMARAEHAHADAGGEHARAWIERARAALAQVTDDPTYGRAALARGRVLAALGDAGAFAALVRAWILDARGASEALSSALAWIPTDEATRARVRVVVDARDEGRLARWRAAFARAEGRRDEARAALREAAAGGERSAARPLLDVALADRDAASLAVAVAALEDAPAADAVLADARRLAPLAAGDDADVAGALDALRAIASDAARPWAESVRDRLVRAWIPSGAPASWDPLLARLDAHARALADLEALAKIAELATLRARPIKVAIVGEFNAGKSTFINALIGADVAPTGVLPTTATLHHLRYAPDPFARIQFDTPKGAPDRLVPLADLRATLDACARDAAARVLRVEILMPLPSLTRAEILDTPGFNAPDVRHAEAAKAAFDEADAAIWLLDAAQAMKQTERARLEEAKAAGLPVQILVNKADRLGDDDRARVLAMVDASLAETGLASWSPPIALSARLALRGKLGDAAALEASGWSSVQALLDREFIGRSEELKERALRRRARATVLLLATRAAREADHEEAADAARRARAEAAAHLAGSLDRDADAAIAAVTRAIGPAWTEWRRDVDVVSTGRARAELALDPTIARYAVDRALERLAPPLASALAALAAAADVAPRDVAPAARALVRAFAAARPFADDGGELATLARAAVAALVDQVTPRAIAPATSGRASSAVTELGAIAAALSPA